MANLPASTSILPCCMIPKNYGFLFGCLEVFESLWHFFLFLFDKPFCFLFQRERKRFLDLQGLQGMKRTRHGGRFVWFLELCNVALQFYDLRRINIDEKAIMIG